jgi:hypothetical protein
MMIQRVFFSIILLLCAFATFRLGKNLGPKERNNFNKLTLPPLVGLKPRFIDVATLGHRGLYEDFISLWIIQNLTDNELKATTPAAKFYDSIQPVLQLGPRIESVYVLSCFVMALDYNEPRFCEEIFVFGQKHFPDSWRLPVIQGFIYHFKLGDSAKAALMYKLAASKPGAPAYLNGAAEKIAAQSGSVDLNDMINLLKEIPEGTKLLELLRPKFKHQIPHDELPPSQPVFEEVQP